jgi:hypothetical protein
MIKANKQKGEIGKYKVFSEGIDNDKDGKFNEDQTGGVNFNQNLTFQYKNFESGSGSYPLCEDEFKTIIDYMYTKWNIYAIFSFGPANNLTNPLKYNKENASKRVITSILKEDETLNMFLSNQYKELVSKEEFNGDGTKSGDFFQWAYFHFGRLSLSTPGWWVPKIHDTTKTKNKELRDADNADLAFLKYAEKQGINNYFVPWKTIEHPDFPAQKVEVGGIVPFLKLNPPVQMIDSLVIKHTNFISELAKLQPSIKIVNLKKSNLGNNLTRIEVDIINNGYLPTHTEMGVKSNWLRKVSIRIEPNKNQKIMSGQKVQFIDRIDGGHSIKFSWLIKGEGKINISAGAVHCGVDTLNFNL